MSLKPPQPVGARFVIATEPAIGDEKDQLRHVNSDFYRDALRRQPSALVISQSGGDVTVKGGTYDHNPPHDPRG
jgi:hypothetical protein